MLAATIPSLRASCQQVDAMLTEDRQCSGCRFTTVSVARLWTSQLLHEIITVRHSEPGEVISGDLGAGAYSLVHRLQRCARTQPQTRILGLCLEDCVIGGGCWVVRQVNFWHPVPVLPQPAPSTHLRGGAGVKALGVAARTVKTATCPVTDDAIDTDVDVETGRVGSL